MSKRQTSVKKKLISKSFLCSLRHIGNWWDNFWHYWQAEFEFSDGDGDDDVGDGDGDVGVGGGGVSGDGDVGGGVGSGGAPVFDRNSIWKEFQFRQKLTG